ncbi:MAG: long-chain-fatty-acid--CoA ligase [Chloroflexota bacterium]
MKVALSPIEMMRRAWRLYPDREAVVDGDVRLTYAAFFARCDRWSALLQRRYRIGRGDRVAIISPNSHTALAAFYAVPRIGAVLVPVNFRLAADDFAYIVRHSGARVVCIHPDLADAVDAIRGELPGVEAFVLLSGEPRDGWDLLEPLLAADPDALPELPEIDEDDLITINYTSGTTSRPKGVMITHRNAAINVLDVLAHVPMTSADRYLWTLPMFHANGWTFTWIVTAIGGTHVSLPRPDPAHVFELIERERITFLCAAPTVLIGLANAPAEQRRPAAGRLRVMTAGAPPAAATIARVEGELGWEILHIYGLTETTPMITISEWRPEHDALPADERARIRARQGVELVASGELRVVDIDGNEVPHDGATSGEITVRGNVVMAGYFDDPAATASAIRDGWFHTGDAAVVHPDGFVEIRDRLKDVIISGGENISSVEVEGVLLRHPAVAEVAVVGMPHERWGESPHAFVVPRTGATVDPDAFHAFAREHLAHFKCPSAYHVVDELPKTATGKVRKVVLRGRRSAIATQ